MVATARQQAELWLLHLLRAGRRAQPGGGAATQLVLVLRPPDRRRLAGHHAEAGESQPGGEVVSGAAPGLHPVRFLRCCLPRTRTTPKQGDSDIGKDEARVCGELDLS